VVVDLPIFDFETITYLFSVVIASLAIFWSINKAIIFAKTH